MSIDTRTPGNRHRANWRVSRITHNAILWTALAILVTTVVVTPPAASSVAVASVDSSAGNYADQATIRRDEHGVPHILAQNEEAAAYAHGYATAEDHLEDMARLFLRARGELASVFGEGSVRDDLRVIELGIPRSADEHFSQVSPLMQGMLNAYAAGYNSYLKVATNANRAPAWAKPVTGRDVLAHCRAVYLLNFAPTPSAFAGAISRPPTASNLWAIGRKKSKSGRGLLLANPHLPWRGAYIFHEVHLNVPGRINVAGAALIGFPVVTIGFNEHLGWTHTANIKFGAEQLYRLTIDPEQPGSYLQDGKRRTFTVTSATHRVRVNNVEESRSVEQWSSHLGPVIHRDKSYAWVYNSPNLGPLDFLTQYNRMGKAKSLAEFQVALQMQQLPLLSVGYADREGNVLYLENGRYPVRPSLPPGERWLLGDRSENDPQGILAHSAIPKLLNPVSGYVQNANNGFTYSTLGHVFDTTTFPTQIRGEGELSLRAQHSLRMLQDRDRFSLDDVVRSQFDLTVPLAGRMKADLVALVGSHPNVSAAMRRAAELMGAWDGRLSAESEGASVFVSWWSEYQRAEPAQTFAVAWDPGRPLETPAGLGDPVKAMAALSKVVAEMEKSFGTVAVPWGQLFRVRRGDVELPAPGATESLGVFNTVEFSRDQAGRWAAMGGTSYVLAVEFKDTPVAMSVLPYSQSADPQSKNHTDQTTLFGRRAVKQFWTSESDIQRHTVRRYAPKP